MLFFYDISLIPHVFSYYSHYVYCLFFVSLPLLSLCHIIVLVMFLLLRLLLIHILCLLTIIVILSLIVIVAAIVLLLLVSSLFGCVFRSLLLFVSVV